MKKFIVTISREFGSGGRLVGRQLSERLGVPFYDRELIELAAEKSGLSKEFIARSDERASSVLSLGLAASAGAEAGYFMQYDALTGDRAFFAQSSVIHDLAEKGSCIIVGRCAGYLLRDNPDCVRILIHAPMDSRIERAKTTYGLPAKGLADKIYKADKGRANYHKHYTGDNWMDARSYDLCINTEVMGIEGAVDTIVKLLENR